ncbi:MAG TPA: translation initiation factor IF-3 [Candidatus Desulfofervidus auxilii]|uniref:Translation initiation factor IF-3 n=1 Tax=Desulfofervidus auxilii TaxID=1621989 RepID=A0A7C0U1R0_DESA2|nr:translation initiation factor IF-3 [Candidatus Desulfofervidus auxilii]
MRVNKQIRAKQVRLIGIDGKQIGIVSLNEALRRAEEEGLDLVEVAPNANPPVCRIMDYGKYKYQLKKKQQEARKKQAQIQVKAIKMRPKIEEHDFQFKLKHIKRFLTEEKARVKVIMWFRGREIVHADLGKAVLQRIIEETKDIAKVHTPPVMEGRNMTMILMPK